MKKYLYILIVFMAVFFVSETCYAKTITVRQKKAKVRKLPKFYAPSIATVLRGDWLDEMGKQNQWIKVKTSSGAVGWIHASSCVLKKLNLSHAGKVGTGNISADEVALAGKGFNPLVEKKYREENPGFNYALLDQIEAIEIGDYELVEFMREGKLGEFGGVSCDQ
ncbi:MAG: SH3 domain-containing protein [Candidatus Ancaeobacter aquaticus]|nr:SH3 domain-containing protein [Candidatus Ancaeobacter aquaticus]